MRYLFFVAAILLSFATVDSFADYWEDKANSKIKELSKDFDNWEKYYGNGKGRKDMAQINIESLIEKIDELQTRKVRGQVLVEDLEDFQIETKSFKKNNLAVFKKHLEGLLADVKNRSTSTCFTTQYKIYETKSGRKWSSSGVSQFIRKSKGECEKYSGYRMLGSIKDMKKYSKEIRKDCKTGKMFTKGWYDTQTYKPLKREAIVICQSKS